MTRRARRGDMTSAELVNTETLTVDQIHCAFDDWLHWWMACGNQRWESLSLWERDTIAARCWADMVDLLKMARNDVPLPENTKDDPP